MPKIDMSEYEIPDDDPDQQRVDSAFIQRGRNALVTRAASAGMTPMEYMAAGLASSNTPTNSEREAPALPAATIAPSLPSEEECQALGQAAVLGDLPRRKVESTTPRIPFTRTSSRVQEYFDSGAAGEHFMEGFGSYFSGESESKPDEAFFRGSGIHLKMGPVVEERADGLYIDDEPAEVELLDDIEEAPEGIIDAEIVEDQ